MISVVVPVYNSENSLTELTERIYSTLSDKHDFELLYIDDGSKDSSWETIEKLVSTYPKIRGFKLGRNFGQHNALLCGIRQAKGSTIVTLDDDLQHSPEDINDLSNKLKDGFSVVYGISKVPSHNIIRFLLSKYTRWVLQKTMGAKVAFQISPFRAFNTSLRDAFANYDATNVNIDVLLGWATDNFSSIEVKFNKRKQGKSGYSFAGLFNHAMNMTTGFSTRPLKVASVIGSIFSTFGLLLFTYVILRWFLEGSVVPGFPFLASMISLFSGVQLISLGILGEYISRLHDKLSKEPVYTVVNELKND